MSLVKRGLVLGLGLAATVGMAWAMLPNAAQDIDPANLHPQRSIGYFAWDGGVEHAEAFQKTAQYEALVESGLWGYGTKVVEEMLPAFLAQTIPRASQQEVAKLSKANEYFQALFDNGMSVSLTDGPEGGAPSPVLTAVLHNLGQAENEIPAILDILDLGMEIQSRTVSGRNVRSVFIPDTPGIEFAWFREAQHLVITVGMASAEQAIAVAEGDTPNVTTSRQWKAYRESDTDFEVASVGWFNFGGLRERFGAFQFPIPGSEQPIAINQFIEALGLQNLGTTASQFGYRGKATIARTFVEAPGHRTGLLALMDQPVFELNDLPPMPAATSNFAGISLELASTWDTTLKTIRQTLKLLPPEASEEFEQQFAKLPQIIGFDLRNDLLAPIGNIHCVFDDPAGGPFGLGFGAAASVQDPERLKQTINMLLDRLSDELENANMPVAVSIQRAEVAGRELITVPAGMFTPTIVVDDKWLAFSLYPQSVKAFLMRQDGQLAAWKPNPEHQAALAEFPAKFSSVSVDDPRKAVNGLYGLIPMLNSGLHTIAGGAAGNTVKAADLPPQELVAAPLFPNVRISFPSETGITFEGRQSLPVMPMPSAQSAVAVPVLVAMLLPAVQQAREAARRTQSKNNMKMLGLAMHNYHDVHSHFPTGTVQGTDLKSEDRLSFLYSVLPYLEQTVLYKQLSENEKLPWNGEQNSPMTDVEIPTFLHPSMAYGLPNATHYAGMAGIGEDAPKLPVGHERAGIFGYDRKTRFRDVTDGTSNTIMITETTDGDIPWAAGGQTLKSLTQEPYINGRDGIGGPSVGGCNILMADGSVRFISEDIDPETMRRLSAMADGKVVNGF